MFWEAFSAIVNSILAAVTVGVLLVNRQQVKASEQQADASEDQVRFMQKQVDATLEQLHISREQLKQSEKQVKETLEAAQRPFLYPTNPLWLQDGSDGLYFDFELRDLFGDGVAPEPLRLKLKNDGAGIALNIRAIIAEPHPKTAEMMNLKPGDMMAPDVTTSRAPFLRSVIRDTALPPGDEADEPHKAGPFLIGWDTLLDDDPTQFADCTCLTHNRTSLPHSCAPYYFSRRYIRPYLC